MHSFFISVQQLQTLEDFVDVSNFSYSIFVNSLSLGTFKLNQPHFIPITSTSTDDHIQILFYTNDHQELYGCISFITKQLIEPKQENILQWATLFDDPEDDLFDGKIGEEDEELPRAFLQVSVKQEQTILQIEDESQINFEAGIRERGQEINLQQTLELSSVACPRYDGPFPKSCDISVMSTHHHKILESPEKSFSCMTTVSIEPMQISLLDTKCPFILERRSSLESVNHTEASLEDQIGLNSENEANKIQQAGTRTTTGSVNIIDHKNDSKNSLSHLNESNAKDLAETIFCVKQKECPETLNNLKDNTPSFTRIANPSVEEENTVLHSKVRELEEVIERLQRENALRSQNEGVYAAKINSLKVEIESIRIEKESCEKKLADMEGLLKAETAVKPQIEAQSKVQPTEGIKNPIIVSSQEITALKSQIQFDETIIQKLHEEIFNLRQKEDENVDLNNKLIVAHQKIRNYQEKFSALAQLFSLFDDEISDLEITEESTCRIYEQLVEKAKETCELKNLNEDLTIRLSICDNKLLADSLLGQIESLKGNINSLEKERETLKEELTKTNQNYMNLTTKYMELSDIFASMKKPSQNEQPASASASKLSTPNLKRSTKQKSLQKNESVDDIEAKLIETSVLHKVPPSLLSRIEYGVYLYMGKKIHLKIQDGQLVVKAGETYKPFQEFVKIKSGNNSASTCNMTKSNPQNLKLLLKDINKEEKSVDQKLRARVSNYHSVQVEQSQRDMSSDFETTSRSICKENARSLSKQTSQTSSLVMEIKNSNLKALTRIDRDRQLKEILSSRMIDRKLSQTMYGRKDKSQRDLTPL